MVRIVKIIFILKSLITKTASTEYWSDIF